jgi:hypothetical protein
MLFWQTTKRRVNLIKKRIMFTNYIETFDGVNCCKLWTILEKQDISIERINKIYTIRAVRLGYSLFHILFNLYLDEAIRQRKWEGWGIHLTQERVCALLFADDKWLLAESENELQCLLYSLDIIIQGYTLQLSSIKCLLFYWKQPIRSKIVINDQPTKQVWSFTFLDCKLTYRTE